jgi:hypothetical protein
MGRLIKVKFIPRMHSGSSFSKIIRLIFLHGITEIMEKVKVQAMFTIVKEIVKLFLSFYYKILELLEKLGL